MYRLWDTFLHLPSGLRAVTQSNCQVHKTLKNPFGPLHTLWQAEAKCSTLLLMSNCWKICVILSNNTVCFALNQRELAQGYNCASNTNYNNFDPSYHLLLNSHFLIWQCWHFINWWQLHQIFIWLQLNNKWSKAYSFCRLLSCLIFIHFPSPTSCKRRL